MNSRRRIPDSPRWYGAAYADPRCIETGSIKWQAAPSICWGGAMRCAYCALRAGAGDHAAGCGVNWGGAVIQTPDRQASLSNLHSLFSPGNAMVK